jgi:hypothetical protein
MNSHSLKRQVSDGAAPSVGAEQDEEEGTLGFP